MPEAIWPRPVMNNHVKRELVSSYPQGAVCNPRLGPDPVGVPPCLRLAGREGASASIAAPLPSAPPRTLISINFMRPRGNGLLLFVRGRAASSGIQHGVRGY